MRLRSSSPRCTPARSPTAGRRRLIAVATSSRHLADGDERLTDPPGEQPLQPEQRYQRFVPAQRSGGNEPAAQHATGDPPSRHAGQVEVLEMTEAEPSRLELLRQLSGDVPAEVSQRFVEGAVQRSQRRHQEDEPSAGLEQVVHRTQRRAVVLDVLQDVQADDGIEPLGAESGAHRGQPQLRDRHVRPPCEPLAQPVSVRYRVEGSMPSTSAARVLLPPSLCSTQVMYARSITSRVGFVCGRSATSGSARRSVSLSGSAARSIVVALLSTTARSRAFSSSRTLPGQSYARSATLASSARALGCSSRSLAMRLRNSSHRIWMSSRRSRSGGRWMAITFSR